MTASWIGDLNFGLFCHLPIDTLFWKPCDDATKSGTKATKHSITQTFSLVVIIILFFVRPPAMPQEGAKAWMLCVAFVL
jgi:hypothetical protein